MKISKLIIPLLGLSQITNANRQELLQIEKEKNIDCQVLVVENEPDYSQQIVKFEPSVIQEDISKGEPKIQEWREVLYSPVHKHDQENFHCYGGWRGSEPRTSFLLSEFYFCDNPKPYWKEDEWAPKANLRFHNDILALDWEARGISSVEIDIIYREWLRSETYIISSYIINYANGAKEIKTLTDGKK